MWDWLKFFPFSKAQETRPNPDEIRGPYFTKPRANKWIFGDVAFYFDAPWSNPVFGFDGLGRTVDRLQPVRVNILTAHLEPVYGNSNAPPDEWDTWIFYSNTWYFVGPWFTGMEVFLDARSLLVSASQGSPFTETNLFHPRVFESAVANFLDDSYGYDRSGKKPHFRGPLNWRVLPLSSSIQAVVCDIHQIHNGSRDNPTMRRLVFFPVSPHHFVEIIFNLGGVEIYRDEVRAKPLFKLTDAIINSMRLQIFGPTQTEWDNVKATCPDMAITDTFGELPWPLFKEKRRKKLKEADITPSNAPNVVTHKP